MKNSIAVTLAVVVTLWAFSNTLFPHINTNPRPNKLLEEFTSFTSSVSLPTANIGSLSPGDHIAQDAWTTFTTYLEFAHAHNLEGVKSLSYQISPTCKDPARITECNGLMDSVYFFAQGFKKSDFNNIYFDERQILIFTDYIKEDGGSGEPVRTVLFFTRDAEGTPRILGIKFCLPNNTSEKKCIETDPAKRDLDHNGWWDDVEAKFYK